MATVRIDIRVVPPADITQYIEKIGGGSPERFLIHLIDFGHPVASALKRGARVAFGTAFLGFHDARITLRGTMERLSDLPLGNGKNEVWCELPDIPTYSRLVQIRRMMGERDDTRTIERLAHWFYTAAQVYAIEHQFYIMDHIRGEWRPYIYMPLWEKRGEFGY